MSYNPRDAPIQTRSKVLRSPPSDSRGVLNVNMPPKKTGQHPQSAVLPQIAAPPLVTVPSQVPSSSQCVTPPQVTTPPIIASLPHTTMPPQAVAQPLIAAPSQLAVQPQFGAPPQNAVPLLTAIQLLAQSREAAVKINAGAQFNNTELQRATSQPQTTVQIEAVNPYDNAQHYSMADQQFSGFGANPGVPQLLIQLQGMIRELDNKFSARIGDLNTNFSTRIGELSNSIDTLKDDIMDQLVPRISKNEDNIAVHEKRLNDVEVAVHAVRNEAEAATKVNDLIVKGVPMSAGEDLVSIYCNIATAIGYTQTQIPRADFYRLGKKKSDAKFDPPLILKFANYIDRRAFYRNYFLHRNLNLSEIGFGTSTQRIFITENLTKQNQEIYAAAMKLRYNKKITSVSTSNGVVMVRRREDEKPTPVLSVAELS
jgi:hypothetical protein